MSGPEPAPIMVSPEVGRKQLAIDPQADEYRPRLPEHLVRAHYRGMNILKICVATTGEVRSVNVIKPDDQPDFDEAVMSKVKIWRYTPLVKDGMRFPFCHTMRTALGAN